MMQAEEPAINHLEGLPDACLAGIMLHLPWKELSCTLPLVNKRLNNVASASSSKHQLRLELLDNSKKLNNRVAWLQRRSRQLRNLHIRHAMMMEPVLLQALNMKLVLPVI
jgi:hypothetical protein